MIQEATLTWRYMDTRSNLIMPWYVKSCLEWLEKQDTSQWNVFEYGAGYSTIWWRLNAYAVDSVEHDERWAQAIGAQCKESKLFYIKEVCRDHWRNVIGQYDCIIVDGEWRDECVEFARDYVKPGGFMIVDNYGQEDFPPADKIDALLEGWSKTVFKQYNHTSWATAVFQKP